MAFTVKNKRELMRNLELRTDRALRAASTGIQKGMRRFEGHVIRTQMSGRPGLNRQTGTLAGSWFINRTTETVTFGTRTKYARVHQGFRTAEGQYRPSVLTSRNGNRFIMPKRLHVPEEFLTKGRGWIRKFAFTSLKREFSS